MQGFHSLKELDEALSQPKGTSFRLFKANLASLQEAVDFIVLEAGRDAQAIADLKSDGRIYRQSHNVVMLSDETFQQLKDAWEAQ